MTMQDQETIPSPTVSQAAEEVDLLKELLGMLDEQQIEGLQASVSKYAEEIGQELITADTSEAKTMLEKHIANCVQLQEAFGDEIDSRSENADEYEGEGEDDE